MKKIFLSILLLAGISFGVMNSANAEQKIAVVDIQKIVDNSNQIQALNKEQEVKIQELEKWVESVKKDIEKQKTTEEKEKVFKKQRDTYVTKKTDIIKSGQTKMQSIMNDISAAIDSQAKAKGYDMVIMKGVVVYGGNDITEDVLKTINAKPNTKTSTKKK